MYSRRRNLACMMRTQRTFFTSSNRTHEHTVNQKKKMLPSTLDVNPSKTSSTEIEISGKLEIGSFVESIPEELLAVISSYLPIVSITPCLIVCKKWRSAVLHHLQICYPFSQEPTKNMIPFVSKEVLHLSSFREVNNFWLRVDEGISMDLVCKGKETFIGGSLHNLLERLIEQVDEREMNDHDKYGASPIGTAVIAGYSGSLEFLTNQQLNSVLTGNIPPTNSPTPPGPLLGSPHSAGNMFASSHNNGDESPQEERMVYESHSFQRAFLKTFESYLSKSNFCRMCFSYLIDLDQEQAEIENSEKSRRKFVKLMKVLNMFIHYCIR